MTLWSRRTILILLASLVLVLLIIRYPMVEHERHQTDSYFIHHLASSIVSDEMARWTFHPLSYVGYYPLSYPSGGPFLLAEFSMMSGLTIETSIYVENLIVAIILCLATFVTVRHLIGKSQLAILATYFVVLGSRLVDTTYWNGSARGLVVALIILVVAVSLRFSSTRDLRSHLPVAILIVGCLVVHHMAVLLLLLGAAYVLTVVMTKYILARLRSEKRVVVICALVSYVMMIVVLPFLMFDYFWTAAVRGMQGSTLFDFDSEFLTVILVGASSYVNQIGLILVFAVAYIITALRISRFSAKMLFPVFLVVVFMPLFGAQLYVSMIVSPFVATMSVLWFDGALNARRFRRVAELALIVLIVSSMAHPVLSVSRWNDDTFASGDQVVVGNQVFNDAAYALSLDDPVFGTCNVAVDEARLQALSEIGFLSGSGIVLALNGDLSREDVIMGIRSSSFEFPRNIYSWYEYDAITPVSRYVGLLMVQGVTYLYEQGEVDGATDYFSTHSKLVVVVDNRWSSSYVTVRSSVDANFPQEVAASEFQTDGISDGDSLSLQSYVFYQSDLVGMYLVQLPIGST